MTQLALRLEPEYQPRWAAWLRHGGDGVPHRFIVWISERWRQFDALNGSPRGERYRHHDAFDAWLAALPVPDTQEENKP